LNQSGGHRAPHNTHRAQLDEAVTLLLSATLHRQETDRAKGVSYVTVTVLRNGPSTGDKADGG